MIKYTYFIVLLAALLGCSNTSKPYLVQGTVPDSSFNGKMIYMESYAKETIIDSALIVDGKFTFKGTIGNGDFCLVKVPDELFADFILEEGTINIDLSNNLPKVGGTTKNDKLNKLFYGVVGFLDRFKVESVHIPDTISVAERVEWENSIVNKIEEEYFGELKATILENPNNPLGFFTLWIAADLQNNIKYFDSLYVYAGDSLRTNPRIVRVLDRHNLVKETMPGNMFKDFTVPKGSLDGRNVKLSDYAGKGKYVLVDFWAHWCGPCKAQIPYLKEVYEKYKGDKFDVVSIAVWDERDKTIANIEKEGMTWPQIVDAQDIPIDLYGIKGIPQIILIAPDGKIVARDLYDEGIMVEVDKAMAK